MSRLLQAGLTLALALVGALAAEHLHLPLPWMMGSLVLTAFAALAGVTIRGYPPGLPSRVRWFFIPVIGTSIASGISPDFLQQARGWLPSLATMVPFIACLQLANFAVFRWLGRYDPATAWFASSPGGATESMLLGEQSGGQASLIVLQHSLRVILAILVVPPVLLAVTGHPEMQAAARAAAAGPPFPPLGQAAVMLASAALGGTLGVRLKIPAGIMLGPLVVGGLLYGSGLIDAKVPLGLLHVAQLIVGTLLGTKFTARDRPLLLRGLRLSLVAIGVSVLLAGSAALALAALDVASGRVLFLSFAPGGLAEMSLVAISLGADPVFVAAHHLARIFLSVILGPLIFRLLIQRTSA
jgi:Putative ammonia monooxygenase